MKIQKKNSLLLTIIRYCISCEKLKIPIEFFFQILKCIVDIKKVYTLIFTILKCFKRDLTNLNEGEIFVQFSVVSLTQKIDSEQIINAIITKVSHICYNFFYNN